MTTLHAQQWVHVPASMLGPGMEEFKAMVEFVGTPLSPATGNADTIMERLQDAGPGLVVKTRLVGFANVSTKPIALRGDGALAGEYWLYVTLSPTHESTGETILLADDGLRSGTFVSRVRFAPLFELRPVTGGAGSIFVDTGRVSLPGFPMELGVSAGRWALDAPPGAVAHESGRSLYYPETVTLRTHRTQAQETFDSDTPFETAKCDKANAAVV